MCVLSTLCGNVDKKHSPFDIYIYKYIYIYISHVHVLTVAPHIFVFQTQGSRKPVGHSPWNMQIANG